MKTPAWLLALLALSATAVVAPNAAGQLLDVWRASDLATLDDGDAVNTWTSASNRTVNAWVGLQPVFKQNITPAGGPVVRFNRSFMTASTGPFGGATAFSIAIVFKPSAAGAGGDANPWYQCTGLVDAEQPGVTIDWGTVFNGAGHVGVASGNPDITTFSSGTSLVDGSFHVAVFTWGGGSQSVYVDQRAPVTRSGVATAPRMDAGFAFGGILTTEGLEARRLVGDIAEIRFFDRALSAAEAGAIISDLTDEHILADVPHIRAFAGNTNWIYLGGSVTLSWDVTNADSVIIDNGVGAVPLTGSAVVSPTSTRTYTLTATNVNATRTASFAVTVDPGVPIAENVSTNTPRNTAVAITLRGSDPQGSNITYSIVTPPQHGSLSGTPPNVLYTPETDYDWQDSFTFKVNDGQFDSAPATVSIKMVPPPTPPSGIVLSSTQISSRAGPGAFVAALRAIDANEGDTHTFTLVPGFGDNAQFTVAGNLLYAGPTFVGGPGVTFSIRLRATDSTGFPYEQTFTLLTVETVPTVVINEIHYNSPDNTVREEFVELYNPSDASVDVSQWRVRGGIDYFIPAETIMEAHSFLVIAENPATIQSRYGVTALGPWSGLINNEGEEITLRDALDDVLDRVDFKVEFPWPIASDGEGASMQLVNPSLDNNLGSSWRSGTPPTPGATNVVFAANAAPNIRQVNHSPQQPTSSDQVVITCKVTDPEGVASVILSYQVVKPGDFIPSTLPLTAAQLNSLNANPALTNSLNPAFEAATNWTTVSMTDDGLNGDALAGDAIYTVAVPPQANRSLVRYRITVADSLGQSRRAPFEDDPSLNFAYFVYDGMPAYLTFSPAVLQSLPVYTLVTRDADIGQCTAWFNSGDQLSQDMGGARNEGRLHFNWEGTIVYDRVVYDHVTYRLRGANGRYHPGKRSFRVRFNPGHWLEAKDQSGEPFPTKWRELTTGKGQSNRGSESFALNEVVNYFLWNKVGVPTPSTFHFHFRVVRGAQESPADPYAGDFWGLNWAQEKYDVNFLDAHGLAKGNLYKLVDNYVLGVDERRYQGPFAVTNAQDFYNIENNLTGFQSTNWLQAHVNYPNWYHYHAVAEAIRHYDVWPSCNKNAAWYFEPIYTPANQYFGRMWLLPYDSTDTWGPTWNGGQDVLYNGIFTSGWTGGDSGQNLEMQKEYRNVMREMRELLFQPDQINAIIDAFAGPLRTFAEADYARWKAAPSPACYSAVYIPTCPGVMGGLPAYVQDMKNFMFTGGNNAWWIDGNSVAAGGWIARLNTVAADAEIPTRPTITYVGTNGYPVDGLVFRTSAFADPQGVGTFAALQWRVAEVLTPGTAVTNPAQLRLEWDAAWDSGEITVYNEFVAVPAAFLQPERLYRARVRHKDTTGRWSNWSVPHEFRPRAADIASALRRDLVFSEIMYNPPAEGAIDGDEFEFLELKNTGTNTLNLTGLFFSDGITFAFTNGTLLGPGQLFLLARNPAALAIRYPGVVVHGVYTGKLGNDGETLTISHPVAGEIVSVTYSDRAPWPVTADGFGFSLVLADPLTTLYQAGADRLGTPGTQGAPSGLGGVVIHEVLSSSTEPARDAIELFNIASTNVSLAGWYLSDDPTFPWKFRIPDDTLLEPGTYWVFDEDDFNPTPGLGTSFSLSSFGDEVYLFSADSVPQLTGYSHGFSFGAAQDGVSFGRYVNSVGEEQFPLQIATTLGAANAGPRIGPVVFSEIHYHPPNPADEFLELRNITNAPVPLHDPAHPTNTWQVNGVGFTFPPGVTLPANGYLLLVSGGPTAFRARFNVPAEVSIYQYPGGLQGGGENIEVLAPDIPTTNGVPYYAVDTVRYNDKAPWPVAADGAGASLQRVDISAYGNDPINWLAAIPTPGAGLGVGEPPVITVQPADSDLIATFDGQLSVSASGTAPLRYQWQFNGDNIVDATGITLHFVNVAPEAAGQYTVVVYNPAGAVVSRTALVQVLIPASIVLQPQPLSVRLGSNAVFSVQTASTSPVSFQWRFNGVPLVGQTSATLTIVNVQAENDGLYDVIVTDEVASIVSDSARLKVVINPSVVKLATQYSVVQGGSVTLSVESAGTLPMGYRWRKNFSTFQNQVLNSHISFLTLSNVQPADGGSTRYSVVLTNEAMPTPGILSSNVYLTVLADADTDGLPDSWESANNVQDPNLDKDGDGLTNGEEYLAGTDPSDPKSYLRVERISVSGDVRIEFNALSNKTYSIQFKNSLEELIWNKLTEVVASPTNCTVILTDPTTAANRYYRLVTPQQP
jgi:hypothetical protein